MRKLPKHLEALASTFEDHEAAVLIADRAGNVLWINRSFTKLTGYASDEVLGGATSLKPFGEHTGRTCASFWRNVLSMKSWRGEVGNQTKSGEPYRTELSVTPVPDQNGKMAHLICTSRLARGPVGQDLKSLLEAAAGEASQAVLQQE